MKRNEARLIALDLAIAKVRALAADVTGKLVLPELTPANRAKVAREFSHLGDIFERKRAGTAKQVAEEKKPSYERESRYRSGPPDEQQKAFDFDMKRVRDAHRGELGGQEPQ